MEKKERCVFNCRHLQMKKNRGFDFPACSLNIQYGNLTGELNVDEYSFPMKCDKCTRKDNG